MPDENVAPNAEPSTTRPSPGAAPASEVPKICESTTPPMGCTAARAPSGGHTAVELGRPDTTGAIWSQRGDEVVGERRFDASEPNRITPLAAASRVRNRAAMKSRTHTADAPPETESRASPMEVSGHSWPNCFVAPSLFRLQSLGRSCNIPVELLAPRSRHDHD